MAMRILPIHLSTKTWQKVALAPVALASAEMAVLVAPVVLAERPQAELT